MRLAIKVLFNTGSSLILCGLLESISVHQGLYNTLNLFVKIVSTYIYINTPRMIDCYYFWMLLRPNLNIQKTTKPKSLILHQSPISRGQLRFCSNCIYQKIFPQFLTELNFFLGWVKHFYCRNNNFVKGDNCPLFNFQNKTIYKSSTKYCIYVDYWVT